jgi:hypothetical protein
VATRIPLDREECVCAVAVHERDRAAAVRRGTLFRAGDAREDAVLVEPERRRGDLRDAVGLVLDGEIGLSVVVEVLDEQPIGPACGLRKLVRRPDLPRLERDPIYAPHRQKNSMTDSSAASITP